MAGIIGDFLKRAPKSGDRPDVERVVRQPIVTQAVRKAWAESEPNSMLDRRREIGFRVRQNYKGDIWTVPYSRAGKPGTGTAPFDEPTMFNDVYDWLLGERTVLDFHSHPIPTWNSAQTKADESRMETLKTPGAIKSQDGMYYYGPSLPAKPEKPFWKIWD